MTNNYPFLTDHSYSLQPVSDDDENEEVAFSSKKKTSRRSSNRMNKAIATKTHRTVSIDRSSSDKENNSTSNHSPSKSKRVALANSRKKLTKRKKVSAKKTAGAIVKKTKPLNRKSAKQIELSDAAPSLSIEERVKLRRTRALPPPTTIILPKQSQTSTKKLSKSSKSKAAIAAKKPTKFFLGSGLDLDNIVSGNRQRRSVQT